MPIVIDATLLIALGARDARSEQVTRAFLSWIEAGEVLHAPELVLFEVASGLTRLVVAKALPARTVPGIWSHLQTLPLIFHPLRRGARTVEIALSLGRSSAYDAAYLALAEELAGEVWTLDGRLFRNARPRGFPVSLLAEEGSDEEPVST